MDWIVTLVTAPHGLIERSHFSLVTAAKQATEAATGDIREWQLVLGNELHSGHGAQALQDRIERIERGA